jgi:hypothetical protein
MSTRDDQNVAVIYDQVPFMGLCCLFFSCYCKCPECYGCHNEFEACCLEVKAIACKPVSGNPKLTCICFQGSVNCIPCEACCDGKSQICCYDSRCAFPCNQEIPCLCNVCGLTLCYKWACTPKFMVTFHDLDEAAGVTPKSVN